MNKIMKGLDILAICVIVIGCTMMIYFGKQIATFSENHKDWSEYSRLSSEHTRYVVKICGYEFSSSINLTLDYEDNLRRIDIVKKNIETRLALEKKWSEVETKFKQEHPNVESEMRELDLQSLGFGFGLLLLFIALLYYGIKSDWKTSPS